MVPTQEPLETVADVQSFIDEPLEIMAGPIVPEPVPEWQKCPVARFFHNMKEHIESRRLHIFNPELRHAEAQAKIDALEPYRQHLLSKYLAKHPQLGDMMSMLGSEVGSLWHDVEDTVAWHRAEWKELYADHFAELKASLHESEFYNEHILPRIRHAEYKAHLLEQKLAQLASGFMHSNLVHDIEHVFEDLLHALMQLKEHFEDSGMKEHIKAKFAKLIHGIGKLRGSLSPKHLLMPYELTVMQE